MSRKSKYIHEPLDPLDAYNKGCKDGSNQYLFDLRQSKWYLIGYRQGRAARKRVRKEPQLYPESREFGAMPEHGCVREYKEREDTRNWFDPGMSNQVPY